VIRGAEPGPAEALALALVALFAVAIAFATWRLVSREDGTSRSAARRAGLLGAAQRRPLLAYFALAYALTWLFWLPIALTRNGVGLVSLGPPITLMMGGALGPIGAGFLMTAIASGGSGVRDLLRRLVLWRVGAVFAILGPIPLFWIGLVLVSGDARIIPDVGALLAALPFFAVVFVSQLFTSGLFEEPGWRGFALPRLQQRRGPLWGTVVLGLCWGCWHLPLFLIPGVYVAGTGLVGVGIALAQFLVIEVAMAVIFTSVFNHTRASVLLAVMLHAGLNSAWAVQGVQQSVLVSAQWPAKMVGYGIFALAVLALTRGRLGYRRDLSNEAPTAAYLEEGRAVRQASHDGLRGGERS
jgi:membrane protease YdiL (CAAX protease family)